MNRRQAGKLIDLVKVLVESAEDLRALGVGGSWARGNPRPGSDLDLIIIARDPKARRKRQAWIRELPFARAGFAYDGHRTATYGDAWSAHVDLRPDAELELTLAAESWASRDPTDAGTRDIVTDAFRIVVDKDRLLARLVDACG